MRMILLGERGNNTDPCPGIIPDRPSWTRLAHLLRGGYKTGEKIPFPGGTRTDRSFHPQASGQEWIRASAGDMAFSHSGKPYLSSLSSTLPTDILTLISDISPGQDTSILVSAAKLTLRFCPGARLTVHQLFVGSKVAVEVRIAVLWELTMLHWYPHESRLGARFWQAPAL